VADEAGAGVSVRPNRFPTAKNTPAKNKPMTVKALKPWPRGRLQSAAIARDSALVARRSLRQASVAEGERCATTPDKIHTAGSTTQAQNLALASRSSSKNTHAYATSNEAKNAHIIPAITPTRSFTAAHAVELGSLQFTCGYSNLGRSLANRRA
jgi:hypothetical protein